MKNNHMTVQNMLRALKVRSSGPRLILPVCALVSLIFAGQFALNLGASKPGGIYTAGESVAKRLTSATEYKPASVSDVVTKALAFKALLTTEQQATLEQTYTTTLARRWSNLPCGANCRNGIQFSTLPEQQLAAATEVIRAAMGTVANEGSDEFNQIRLADEYLRQNGGGSGYGQGIYFIAFLNTPTNTGAWMLQFGGHHYAANIAYNQGRVVSTTPLFEALEPISFTLNGTAYAPLAQEHDSLAAMLASLTTEQLATARLTQTFNDVTMSPGESNGGNGTFPTTKVGIAVSSLSAAQKQLVLEAMKPWVRDAEDTVAANLLAVYESELEGTYIAYTGTGTSGNAPSFLVAATNYARIDGPSVWIEFAVQNGAVFRNQIHYHTIWRDRNRDYGKDLSLTTGLDGTAVAGAATVTSAASYVAGSLAPEAIGTIFGTGLASSTASATAVPLPTTLGGIQVQVRDSAGVTRTAPLFYASPTQISFQNPADTSAGSATVTVLSSGSTVAQTTIMVEQTTPGLFAANSNGQGVAAAAVVRVKPDGSQTTETVLQLNQTTNQYEAVPLTIGDTSDQLFLILFGTGFRNRSSVSAAIGGTNAEVTYAGAQGSLIGVDQANVRIPAGLAGRGSVNVILTVDGKASNTVTINIR